MDRYSGSDTLSADWREQSTRFAFQVRPRRTSWAGIHTSVLLWPPDRRRIVTVRADGFRVCFGISARGLSSDRCSHWDRSEGWCRNPSRQVARVGKVFCTVDPNIVGFLVKSLSSVVR